LSLPLTHCHGFNGANAADSLNLVLASTACPIT